MLTKNLNENIVIGSKILNILLVFYFAILLSHFVWWVISPAVPEVYMTKSSVKTFDSSVKTIINRIPFGEIVIKESTVAVVKDDIKLTGVYLNTPKNSIAFLEVNKKAMIVKVGDQIVPGTILKTVNPQNIIITQDSSDITINLNKGSGNASENNSSSNIFGGNFGGRGQSPQSSYIPDEGRGYPQQGNQANFAGNAAEQQQVEQMEEMRARRRRAIEEFAEKAREESPNPGR